MEVSLKRKNNTNFWSYLAQFLEWEIFQKKDVEKIKTHVLCSLLFSRKFCRLWDNVDNIVEPGRSQTTIWRMHNADWIRKAAITHSEYVILISFPRQQWLHKRASSLLYAYMYIPVL